MTAKTLPPSLLSGLNEIPMLWDDKVIDADEPDRTFQSYLIQVVHAAQLKPNGEASPGELYERFKLIEKIEGATDGQVVLTAADVDTIERCVTKGLITSAAVAIMGLLKRNFSPVAEVVEGDAAG